MTNPNDTMTIETINLSELHPYENNPRVNDDAAAKLQDSIRTFGFRVPMLIDKDNVIVAGHTRYKAAQALGLEAVPCIRIEGLTDDQIRAFRIADNKYGELSHWDTDLLKGELSFLKDVDFDMESLGFNPYELQSYLEPFTFEYSEEDSADENEPASNVAETENGTHEFPTSGRIIIWYDNDDEYDWLTEKLKLNGDKAKITYKTCELMEDVEDK